MTNKKLRIESGEIAYKIREPSSGGIGIRLNNINPKLIKTICLNINSVSSPNEP